MATFEVLQGIALSFDEVTEEPHMEKISFRIRKKIFVTFTSETGMAVLKLTPVDQSVFCDHPGGAFKPVPGGWGRQGWTQVNLDTVEEPMLRDAVTQSYCLVAPKTLADKYQPEGD